MLITNGVSVGRVRVRGERMGVFGATVRWWFDGLTTNGLRVRVGVGRSFDGLRMSGLGIWLAGVWGMMGVGGLRMSGCLSG